MLYSNAWLDVSTGPLLLNVPDMGNRYYVLQFLDYFTLTFVVWALTLFSAGFFILCDR
jgi:hypothetical protein